MKLKLSTCLILLFCVQCTFAQSFKMEAFELSTFTEFSKVKNVDNSSRISNGIGLGLRSVFKNKFHATIGVNLATKRLGINAALNKGKIPGFESQILFTSEIASVEKLAYRLIETSLNFGYAFYQNSNKTFSFYISGSNNYILSGTYKSTSSQYNGKYAQVGMNSRSLSLGLETTIKISKNTSFIHGIEYSIFNKIDDDKYIFTLNGTSLSHKFLRLKFGILLM